MLRIGTKTCQGTVRFSQGRDLRVGAGRQAHDGLAEQQLEPEGSLAALHTGGGPCNAAFRASDRSVHGSPHCSDVTRHLKPSRFVGIRRSGGGIGVLTPSAYMARVTMYYGRRVLA